MPPELIDTLRGRKLYRVQREDLPKNTYIIANPSSRQIHFNPTITDFELYKLSTECNETFLRFAYRLGLFKETRAKDVCELILLSGGFYYHLNQAFYNVLGYSLPAAFIGVKRVLSPKPHGKITYDNLEAVQKNSVTLIGDTIATGATLLDSVRYYLARRPQTKKILIFTIAGAVPGAQRVARLEEEIRKTSDTKLYIFFSDGIFGLALNQTDMHYFHSDSILAPGVKLTAERRLGKVLGERLCVIWDWGQRNKDPVGHLQEVIRVSNQLGPVGQEIVKRARLRLKERDRML